MPDTTRECQVCGASLTGRRRTLCSDECSREAARRRASRWYHANRHDPDWYARRRQQGRRAYARWADANPDAVKANMDRWRAENAEAIREYEREYRQENADLLRAKNQRRRARLVDAFVADVDPEAIWDRDGGICQLCHEPIDVDLAWPDPMSRTLDHIVALVNGGTHEPDNVQLAHARCNSRKGDREHRSASCGGRSDLRPSTLNR